MNFTEKGITKYKKGLASCMSIYALRVYFVKHKIINVFDFYCFGFVF